MSHTVSGNNVLQLTDVSFEKEVLHSSLPVLVDFYADWCSPCRLVAPVVEEVAGKVSGQARVGKVNVDQNPEVARQHRISALPTVLVFRNGEEVDRLVGVQPASRYLEALQNEA